MIAALKEEADVILFDCPPLLARSDALMLAAAADGTIVVADANRTRVHNLKHTLRSAAEAHGPNGEPFVGVVLNRFRPSRLAYYTYYGYYYGSNRVYGEEAKGSLKGKTAQAVTSRRKR